MLHLIPKKETLILLLCLPCTGIAQISAIQQTKIDSLKLSVKHALHDSSKIKAWVAWDNIIYKSNPALDLKLNLKVDSLCDVNMVKTITSTETLFFKKSKAGSLNNLGIIYKNRGELDKALSYYNQSITLNNELGNKKGAANALSNAALIHRFQGNQDLAIKYYAKTLKIFESLNDKKSIAKTLNNLGLIYNDYDIPKAIQYYKKSLAISEELDDKLGIRSAKNNLGATFLMARKFKKAMKYFQENLIFDKSQNNWTVLPATYLNIGNAYQKQAKDSSSLLSNSQISEFYNKAIEAYSLGIEICEAHHLKNEEPNLLNSLSGVYFAQAKSSGSIIDLKKAYEFSLRSFEIAKEMGDIRQLSTSANSLWVLNKNLGNHESSLEMYELHIKLRDSLESLNNQKEVIKHEYKYKYETQAAEDSLEALALLRKQDAKLAYEKAQKEDAENAQQRNEIIIYFVLAIVAVILFFVYMVVKSLRLVREQKEKVDEAYDELEEKNNEILDSINYAKRIQSAILPPHKVVKSYLPSSFILYKPKDIVAGDFYWLEPLENKVLFAACDCTGHGVPGAMVSVVCNNGLNRAVREHKFVDPGEILNKTREIVISEFEKSEEEVKDGMDVALCSLEGNMLKYAGANNPLWIIRKGAIEIEEIKANKQPIGKFDQPLPYTTHHIELKPGDTFYIFSDGLADQFGGVRGKKYKAANFKKLLISIQNHDMEKQRALIDQTFEEWKGSIEQLDDVCVIGVRIT